MFVKYFEKKYGKNLAVRNIMRNFAIRKRKDRYFETKLRYFQ